MRLQPVYLVAPEPQPPSMPTRRAWLLAGFAASAGAGLGFGAGWWNRGRSATAASSMPLDPRWQRALELARPETSIQELLDHQYFLASVVLETERAGRRSDVLWRAVVRLIDHVVTDASVPDRRLRALSLLDLLRLDHPSDLRLDERTEALRRAAVR